MAVFEELNKIIRSVDLVAEGTPSVSIAILEDGRVSAHVITGGQENTDTIYQACSISKPITALAVAKLIDEGHFSYGTRVVKHLPDKYVSAIGSPADAPVLEQVTVAMLLSHTSGLSQGGFPGYSGSPPTVEDILSGKSPSNTPRIQFETFPGVRFQYSGGGYTVLQVFLETIMNTPFDRLMYDTVLRPLGMNRSHYGNSKLPTEEDNFAKAHFTGYTAADVDYHTFPELAAAGLWTTPSDLLKAIIAIQESLHSEKGFITQERAREMLTRVPQSDAAGTRAMSLGWSADEVVFAHSGSNDPGYRCYVFGSHGGVVNASSNSDHSGPPCPDLKNGIAILTNSIMGTESLARIVNAVYYIKGWPRFTSLPSGFSDFESIPHAAPEGTSIESGWQAWEGAWEGKWTLVNEDGPRLAFGDSKALRLREAAAPVKVFPGEKGGREFIFVVDGLRTAVRLTFQDQERVLEIWLEGTRPKVLKREDSYIIRM